MNQDIQRINVGARLSDIAVFGNVVYLAGQVPDDLTLDIKGQTLQVLATIDGLLKQVNSDRSRILMAQIYLADMADFADMNAVWDAWVNPGQTPPRATVNAKLARTACKVEIVVTAAQKRA